MAFNSVLQRNPNQGNAMLGEYPNGLAPVPIIVGENGTTLANFDAGWTMNAGLQQAEHSSGLWNTLDTGHAVQSMSISPNGVIGNSLKIDVLAYGSDGLYKHYIAYDADRGTTLAAPDTHNRFVMYTKIPHYSNILSAGSTDYTFHLGTYSKDPATAGASSSLGNHWYHYYHFEGNDQYWMKVYMDERPQHEVGVSVMVETNPTSVDGFNYFDGLTRLYWQMTYGAQPDAATWDAQTGPYSVSVDQLEYYTESRAENAYSINNVVITYFGSGLFHINWANFSQYDAHNNTFELRYSTSPINDLTDFAAATKPPEQPVTGWNESEVGTTENHVKAVFTIPNIDNNATYYFAIQDLEVGTTKDLKRVDYNINAVNS